MATERTRDRWWGQVALGVIALIVGVAMFIVPGISLVVFLWIFGAFMLLSGFVLIGYAFSRPKGTRRRTFNFIEGGVLLVIGVAALLAPGITALWAVYLVAIFAIIAGVMQIVEGLIAPTGRTTLGASNRWLLVIAGVWSLLIGVLIVLFPGGGILAILWLVALFLIVWGALNILAGIRARPAEVPVAAPR